MTCTSCGANNRDDAQFCRNCGGTLRNPYQTPSVTEAPTAPLPPNPDPSSSVYKSQFSQDPLANPSYANHTSYQPPMPGSPSGKALASMILSILSLFTCGPFMSIPGMIMGKMEMTAISEGRSPAAGMTNAKVGFWVGMISTILFCGGILLAGIFGFLGSILSAAGSGNF